MKNSNSIVVQSEKARSVELAIFTKQKEDLTKLLEELDGSEESFIIEDSSDYLFAGELLKHVKHKKQELEDRRKTVTKPLNEALEAFRALYRPSIKQWEEAEKLLKRKIEDWHLKEARRKEEAMKKIAEASSAQDYDSAYIASLELTDTPQVTGVTTTEHWVLDSEKVDLKLVPREFLMLDMDSVKSYIKAHGKDRPADLPGLPFKKAIKVVGSKKG